METEQEALEGVVSKQQVTALGGTVRVWLLSSTQGTEGAGNAMSWEEKGDPIPSPPPYTSLARMACKQLGSCLKERGFGMALRQPMDLLAAGSC